MSQPIRVTGSTQPRIQITGSVQPRIEAEQVAATLGGEPLKDQIDGNSSPMMLYALRTELFRRWRSHAKMPQAEDTNPRVKIPLSAEDWTELEELAGELAAAGFSPTPGEVATVLLHAAIRSVRQLDATKQDSEKLVEAIARQLAASGAGDKSE
jgi:hypothetical protein